jgi:hypothetical protein
MSNNISIRSILTDQSISNEQVSEWVDDLFKSFEDENGEIHISANIITADYISV